MSQLLQSYITFRNLLDKHGMGYEFEPEIWNHELVLRISFGFIGTNYAETGWVCTVYNGERGIYELHERAYLYAIELLEKHEKMLEEDPAYLTKPLAPVVVAAVVAPVVEPPVSEP